MTKGAELPGLTGAPLLSAEEPATGELLGTAEASVGMRCYGCGERIENGFRFSYFVSKFIPEAGGRAVILEQRSFCTRDECDGADEAKKTAHVVEKVQFVWLDEMRESEDPGRLGAEPSDG